MATADRPRDPARDETPEERADRNFAELLQEVRVAQTGVQILFAFLLTLPFSARFGEIAGRDRMVYVVTLLASAGAIGLFIGPAAYHRMIFRQDRKPELVRVASRMAGAGMGLLLVSIMGSVFVVMDTVVGLAAAVAATVALGTGCLGLWYVLPLRHRPRRAGERE
jgi:hypothetical protein